VPRLSLARRLCPHAPAYPDALRDLPTRRRCSGRAVAAERLARLLDGPAWRCRQPPPSAYGIEVAEELSRGSRRPSDGRQRLAMGIDAARTGAPCAHESRARSPSSVGGSEVVYPAHQSAIYDR
jgi:hypothetical protein